MQYKSVIVTKFRGPEVLRVAENDLREPSAKEVRIRVLAASVSRVDIESGSANARLETGQVVGNLVLVAPELL